MYGSTLLVPRVPSGGCRAVAGIVSRAPPAPSRASFPLSSAACSSSSVSSWMSATETESCWWTGSEGWRACWQCASSTMASCLSSSPSSSSPSSE